MTELMRRRRALMGAGSSSPSPRLPAEYQEVAYIKCGYKGYNYVLTGVSIKDAYRVVIDGTVGSTTETLASLVFYQSSNARIGYFNNNSTQAYSCDPVVANSESPTGTFTFTRTGYSTETAPLYLFGGSTSSATRSRTLTMTSVSIYDSNNTLKFQGVPAYKKADTKIGLYDIVGQEFHQAGGTFTKGADV